MTPGTRTTLRFALGLLVIVLVMANSLVYSRRVDLTEDRLYTLSAFTRELIAGLDQQVTITYYLSERLDRQFPQPREIVDLLEEYEAVSRGRIETRVVDPMSLDRPGEVEAVGVVPQQLQVSEQGEQRLAVVYSGIVIDYLDRRETLPFVFSATGIEYDVSAALASLVRDHPYDLGIVVGNPSETLESHYGLVAGELSRSYDVRRLETGAPIPDDVELVIVIDAQRLETDELSRVSEYLERGGAVLFTVERFEIDLAAGLEARPVGDAPIVRLLRGY
ncbi:MAG: GldG family protein, partial [Spirochaetota bacterium]